MTDCFFDTDCLSAFLWVKGESILCRLYSGEIILPAQVYNELKHVPHLLARADSMRDHGDLRIESMEVGTREYEDYLQMTLNPEHGARIIGSGEAAAIAMAKERGGILASNNLRDISFYVSRFHLHHITTGMILKEALCKEMITEAEGNELWSEMIRKRRILPTRTFSEYLSLSDPER